MNDRRNLAARLGGWSVRHRKTAILGWLLLVVALTVLGTAVGQQQMTMDEYAEGDSARAMQVLDEAGIEQPASEMVLVHSETATADTTQFRAAVDDLVSGLQATGLTTDLREPYATGLISRDRHSALVQFAVTGAMETAYERVQPVLDAVNSVRAAHPELTIDQFGEASANKWFNDTILKDFHRAEWTAIPLALGILLVAFGALLAAVLPVGLAMTAFLAANGLLALVSQRVHVDNSASSVMLLVGLAVGVDYCLFYLRREREERANGHDAATSLRIAAATSGRSVLISGLTVVVAMSGMFLSGMLLFDGFALATIMVVLVAITGSVTVLPALLSLLGDRVDFGRIPGLARLRRPQGGSRVWGAVLDRVLARPGLSALASGAFLLLLAVPVLGMHTERLSLDKQLPADSAIVQSYDHIVEAFPGGPSPARVVVQADDIQAPQVRQAVTGFTAAAMRTGLVNEPIQVTTHAAQNVIEIEVPLAGNGTDSTSRRALDALRDEAIPQTFGAVPDTQAYVTGELAFSVDFNDQLRRGIVPVFVFVLGLAFVLILVAFRSLTIAVVSVGLNLLSVAASFGVIVTVFQHGWGAGLVGTEGVGAIESWLPLFAFVILFGLSMDYHVFVVSRIREAHDNRAPTREAVSHGIRTSAGVVTSAAIIMVAVFAVLATLSMQVFKQMGVGLAVAILLDATVVRAVLLPSVLSLLGDRCWYLPRWLSFLSRSTSKPDQAEPGQPQPRPQQEVGMPG
ncbi:MMPL family transporter [Phytohabitans houttuyneae]|uniref:Membrane protein n=1 Tax=Phytohabitans houttuyneae TaxID=1076126 RepID=A0A6V8K9R6_9ACTN|nr:MMPL family transporter [Phytohabitans houttuyneae]GFJ81973.1 membrane protein [Phytohabitans houttuyneae]